MNINNLGQLKYLDFSEVGITDGLVAYWKLNGDVKDYSGNGYDGTLSGPVVTSGLKDLSYRFGATSGNYVSLPNSVGYTTTVSAFAWFKREGVPGSGYHIIMGGQELEISIPDSTGEARTGLVAGSRKVSNHGGGLTDNNWHFVGFTFDGTNKVTYIDGIAVGTLAMTGTLTYSFTNRRLGVYGSSTSYYSNGKITNSKIFNRALTPDEILIEYKQGLTTTGMQLSSSGVLFLNKQINEGL